ncbi:hypothetical protein THTE_0202 [Thermogutta terrifontis]|uniref:Uncharacterized protein n=1 Tax=Thermogutta terrifontis TaxID=1331910 RepID=A0A286RA05_9BACT|nr:hypothetical protein THTE_0202 [Thermogutta terrifontis]
MERLLSPTITVTPRAVRICHAESEPVFLILAKTIHFRVPPRKERVRSQNPACTPVAIVSLTRPLIHLSLP